MTTKFKMPEPLGYLCDWGNDSYGSTRQVFYYGERGSAIEDDWNEHPKVQLNTSLYDTQALRDVLEQAARIVDCSHPLGETSNASKAIRAMIGEIK